MSTRAKRRSRSSAARERLGKRTARARSSAVAIVRPSRGRRTPQSDAVCRTSYLNAPATGCPSRREPSRLSLPRCSCHWNARVLGQYSARARAWSIATICKQGPRLQSHRGAGIAAHGVASAHAPFASVAGRHAATHVPSRAWGAVLVTGGYSVCDKESTCDAHSLRTNDSCQADALLNSCRQRAELHPVHCKLRNVCTCVQHLAACALPDSHTPNALEEQWQVL